MLTLTAGDENVFVFSTHPDSHAIIRAEYGRWSLIHVRAQGWRVPHSWKMGQQVMDDLFAWIQLLNQSQS